MLPRENAPRTRREVSHEPKGPTGDAEAPTKFEQLCREIQVGIDQADRGELLDGPEVFRRLRQKTGSGQGR